MIEVAPITIDCITTAAATHLIAAAVVRIHSKITFSDCGHLMRFYY